MKTGWLLVPVSTNDGANTEDPATFAFESSGGAEFNDEWGGAWGYISTETAPTFDEAKALMRRLD